MFSKSFPLVGNIGTIEKKEWDSGTQSNESRRRPPKEQLFPHRLFDLFGWHIF